MVEGAEEVEEVVLILMVVTVELVAHMSQGVAEQAERVVGQGQAVLGQREMMNIVDRVVEEVREEILMRVLEV